ncbi:hypothetical protein [Salinigranum sp. GCM10025319]|uniref:hypothetical protein n=1 Tax=Salinigranum sp. GCM10025319 TaxID=3252687 RepID=UPI0036177414
MTSPSTSTTRLVVVFVAGLVVGSVAVATAGAAGVGFDVPGATADGPDPDSPPTGIATGTGCLPAEANTGWIHEVATGTSRTLTANVTVAHGPDETVDATFEAIGSGVYRLRVDVVRGETSGVPDCPTGSTVDAAASLPMGYERVEVVVDGRTVGSMVNDGDTGADLRTFAWNATA